MTSQNFYDERINTECGKIYQRGILFATVVALIYGILHYFLLNDIVSDFYTLRRFSNFYAFLLPEATVFVTGCVILLLGALLYGRARDEREICEKHHFYLTAGKVFLVAAFIGYDLAIPFSTRQWSNDVPLNYLPRLYECLGLIYLYYAFKKRDIFFNYTFIHESKGTYYKRVFLNLAKLAWWLFPGFFGGAMIDLGMHQSILNFWAILIAYILSVLTLGLEYLFISWTEKLSYDEKEHRGLHMGTFIQFIFLLGNTLIAFGFTALVFAVSDESLLGGLLIHQGYHLGEILAVLTTLRGHFAHECSVLTAMVLCKFMCQIRNCRVGRRAIGGIVILTSVSLLIEYVQTFVLYFLSSKSYELVVSYVSISNVISLVITLINSVLWTVLIYDLVTSAKLHPLLWAVAGVRWLTTILGAASSLLGHQGLALFYGISGGLLGFASLLLLLVLLHRHEFPHEHEEYV